MHLLRSPPAQFEDDPTDYILSDMEGSDSDTRRRCAIELLRGMCR